MTAPPEVPPSSFTSNWMLGLLNSASAISAAFFMDCATVPALPPADSGRIRPTRTPPAPIAAGCSAGTAPLGGGLRLNVSTLEHPPSTASRPLTHERRDNRD